MEKLEIDSYKRAGKIASEIKNFAREFIKPEMKLIDIANAIDEKIEEMGGEPAFPVNLSLNEIAAHYTPDNEDETIAEGILKIDIGIHINGFIADTAFSMDLTKEKKFEKMIELNTKILKNVEEAIKPEMEVRTVGDVAQETLERFNEENKTRFSIIKSLSGHALGQNLIHAGITFSNYRNEKKTKVNDMAFAIEPFVTTGIGDVYEGSPGGIYVVQKSEKPRDKDSREILNFINDTYQGRPFCKRWLRKHNFQKINLLISNLRRQGIIYEYPQLIEKSKAPVSQEENTFLVNDEGVIVTTK